MNKDSKKLSLAEKILICIGLLVLLAGGGLGVRAAVDGFSDGSTEETEEEADTGEITVTSVENGICYMSDGSLQTESGEKVVKISSSLYGDAYYISEDDKLLTLDRTGVYDESTGLICYAGAGTDGADLYKSPDGGVLVETDNARYLLYDDGTKKTLDGGIIGDDGSITYESSEESGDTSGDDDDDASGGDDTVDPEDEEDEELPDDTDIEDDDSDVEESVLLPDDILEDSDTEAEYDSVEDVVEITSIQAWDETEYPTEFQVILGTEEGELNLPEFAICSATVVREYILNDEIVDSASGDSDTLYLPVIWDCDDYDPDTEGVYTFTPEYDKDAAAYDLEVSDEVWDTLSSRTVEVVDTLGIEATALGEEIDALGAEALTAKFTIYKEDDTSFTASLTGANDIPTGLVKSVRATVTGGSGSYTYAWTVDGESMSATGSVLSEPIDFDEDYSTSYSKTHAIKCTVTDSDGASAEFSFNVTVHQPFTFNMAYEITDGGSGTYNDGDTLEIHDGTTVNFTASTTTSGRLVDCTWTLDGSSSQSGTDNYKKVFSYSLSGTNTHTLKCKMTDEFGHSLTRTVNIMVSPRVSLDVYVDSESAGDHYDEDKDTLYVSESSEFKIVADFYGGTGVGCKWTSVDNKVHVDASRITTSDGESVLSVSNLSEGTYSVTAKVSDKGQKPYASDSYTLNISVSKNMSVTPTVSPLASSEEVTYNSSKGCYVAKVLEGEPITLGKEIVGGVTGDYDYSWTSADIASVNGKYTSTVKCTLEYDSDDTSANSHMVSLTVTDADGNKASYDLELDVIQGLEVSISPVTSMCKISDKVYVWKTKQNIKLSAVTNRSGNDLTYNWTVSDTGFTLEDSDKSTVLAKSGGSNNGKKFRFTVTVTDTSLTDCSATDYVDVEIRAGNLSIDALANASGKILHVLAGETVTLNAIYYDQGSGTVTWHAKTTTGDTATINGVDGKTGMSCTFTAKASDDDIPIWVTDNSGKTSDQLTVKIIDSGLKLTADTAKVEFAVTKGYTISDVHNTFTYTLTHSTGKEYNARMEVSDNNLGDYISEKNNGITLDKDTDKNTVVDTLTLESGLDLDVGDYNSYYVAAKYGLENSLSNAWKILKVPVTIKIMEPTRIATPTANQYQSADDNPIDDGDSVTLKPTITEYEKADADKTKYSNESVTYQWYQIKNYAPGASATIDEKSTWTALEGKTSQTLTVAPEGSAKGKKYYAYMLVATDRYGTETCSDYPMVVCVGQSEYSMMVEKVDDESEGSGDTLDFGSAVVGYSSKYLSNSPQKIKITNTGNRTITKVSIKEYDTSKSLIGSAFNVTGFNNGSSSIEPGSYLILTISPADGLSAGDHQTSLTVQGQDSSGNTYTGDTVMSLDFVVQKVSGSLVITGDTLKDGDTIDFGNITEGYTEDMLPDAQYITLTNNGNANFDIKAPTSQYFEFWYRASDIDIQADPNTYLPLTDLTLKPDAYDGVANLYHNNLTVKVLPKTGLMANGDSENKINESVKFEYGTAGRYTTVTFKLNVEPQVTADVIEYDSDDKVELEAKVTGGSAPYSYNWYDKPSTETTRTSLSSKNILDLPEGTVGTYYLHVKDANGAETEVKYVVNNYKLLVSVGDGSSMTADFGTVVAGYTEAPSTVTITLTNGGTDTLTGISYSDIDNFEITGLESTKNLAAGKSITLTVTPKLNLAVGEYDETFVFQSDETSQTQYIELKMKVIPGDESLAVSPEKLTFATTSEGYTKLPDAQKVTVTNKGNKTVTVKMPSPKSYKLTGFTEDKTLKIGESFTFSVQPIKGLKAGTQSEFISLQTGSGVTGVTAEMKVNDAPKVNISGATSTDPGVATTLTANVTGGTEPYTYKWSTGGTGSTEAVSPDSATQITVTVTDAAGVTAKATFNISVAGQLTVTVTGPSRVNSGASATLTAAASGGTSPYTYTWSTGLAASSITVTPEATATYSVTATDKLGSTATASITVTVQNLEVKEKEQAVHALTGNNTKLSLGSAVAGYGASSYSKQFTITNNGNTTEVLNAPKSTAFVIYGMDGETKLAAGESITVTIVPKANMTGGSYNEVLSFTTNSGTSIGVAVDFEVEASPADVEISHDQTYVDKTYDMGSGTVNYQIDCDTSTQLVGVGDTSSTATAILDESELAELKSGIDCNIRVTTRALNGAVSTGDKTLLDNGLNEYRINNPDITVGMYMDITIEKQVGNDEWVQVTETDKPVNLVVDIPDELTQAGTDYYLLRLHDDEVATVAEWKTGEEEVNFNTTKCSTYAICYVPDEAFAALHGQGIHMNDNGEFVDKDGNPMDKSGKSFDSNGNIVDSNGNHYDTEGNLVDENGDPISNATPVWVIIVVLILGLAAAGGLVWLIIARSKQAD